MNDLETFVSQHTGRRIHKWHHYLEIYDRHFRPYRGQPCHVLEIGVRHGGSLQMWKHYFGASAQIYGVDVDPECSKLTEDQIQVIIGDQEDREFLHSLKKRIPHIDILIDDGGHTMTQQIATFEVLFEHVAPKGIYLVEDTHSSYWQDFGGGYQSANSFVEYSKGFVDELHAWHSEQPERFEVSDFTRAVHGLHFYDSMLIIEKRPMTEPHRVKVGKGTLGKKGWLGQVGRRIGDLTSP